MKKITFSVVTALMVGLTSFGQNFVIFQQTQQQHILINQNYINYTGNDQTREILNTFANDWQKPLYQTEFTLFVSYDLKVVQTGANQYSLNMQGRNIQPTFDLFLAGFKMNDQVIPDLFSFEYQLVNPNGTIRNQNRYSNITPGNSGTFFDVNILDLVPMNGVQLRITNFRVAFSQRALQNFNQRVQLIRNYKSCNLNAAIQNMKGGSWNNIDSLESLKRLHYNSLLTYKEFSQSGFQTLNADPEGKFQQSGELKYLIDLYQTQLTNLNTNAPYLLYLKGIEQSKAGNNAASADYFRRSHAAAPGGYLPACLMQSRLLANHGDADSASKLLLRYAEAIPDSLKSDALQSAIMVFSALQNGAQAKAIVKNYPDALRLLSQSEKICASFQPAGCQTALQKNRKLLVDGGYKQYVGEAKSAATGGDYRLADQKINEARNLLTQYPGLITQPLLAEQTMLVIKQGQYDKLMISAKLAMNTDLPEVAYDHYQEAISIQKLYKIKMNPDLSKSAKVACRLKVLKGFRLLETGLSSMKVAEARKVYEGLLTQINFNDLQQDAEIKKWSLSLSKKLGSIECEEARKFAESTESEARNLAVEQKFAAALEKYQSVLKKTQQLPYCGIDSVSLLKQIAQLQPAQKFEWTLNTAAKEVESLNYAKAMELLSQADELYQREKLSGIGVNLLNRETWTTSSTNDAFFGYQMADYYFKQKDCNASFRLVKWSIQHGISAKLTKDLQVKNGQALARKDHASKGNSPDVWVLSYTNGAEKKLKYFKKAYLKQWKSLEK